MDYSKITLGELLSSNNETIKRNATGILKALQRQNDYYSYHTPEDYQKHLRKGGKIHDLVIVSGILFTQDEYDIAGRYITYGNRKHKKALTIETTDRYNQGLEDATVTMEEMTSWRNDINYAE